MAFHRVPLQAGPIEHLGDHGAFVPVDELKVGLFYDQAVFGFIDRATGRSSIQTAGAGGPALHLLLADEFLIDLYVALGWKTDGRADFAPGLALRQVF